ncbi:MAG: ABC transporter substrate-binding protein, partial [Acidimicrobiales bacterium]
NMRTLLADKALLVSGITVSDTCALLAPSLSAARVPELCTTIPAVLVLAPPPYVYAMSDPETMWVKAITHVIQIEVHTSAVRVATILPDASGLHDLGQAFDADAAALDWTLAASETVPLDQLTNVSTQVSAVLAGHPDAVLIDIAAAGAIAIVRQLRAGGFTGPVLMANADYPTLEALKDPGLFQVWPNQLVGPSSTSAAARSMVAALAEQGVTGISGVNAVAIRG